MLIEFSEDDLECEKFLFLGMINLDVNIIENWIMNLYVGDIEVQFFMDIGVKFNVFIRDIYYKLNIIVLFEKFEVLFILYLGYSNVIDGMVIILL